jgi:glycosyltransferase involved in cell wall biosynthesis
MKFSDITSTFSQLGFWKLVRILRGSNRKGEYQMSSEGKTLRITNYSSGYKHSLKELSIEIRINSCKPVMFTPSSLVGPKRNITVWTSRAEHYDHEVEPVKEVSFEIIANTLIINSHKPLLLDLDHIVITFREFFDSADRKSRIAEMSMLLNSRESHFMSLQSRIGSSFTFGINNLATEINGQASSNSISLVTRIKDKQICKRILLISHEDSHTGAPIYLNQLSQVLTKQGFQIHILSMRPNFRNGCFSSLRKKHSYLEDYRRYGDRNEEVIQNWMLTEVGIKAFSKAIRKHKPELILVNTTSSSDAIRMSLMHDVPSIFYVHESWKYDHLDWEVKNSFQQLVKNSMEAASLVFFGSNATNRHWQNANFSFTGETLPTYRRVAIPKEDELISIRKKKRDELGIPSEAKVFLSIATFEPRKRIRDIVSAFNRLNDSNAYLILVGASGTPNDDDVTQLINNGSKVKLVRSTQHLVEYYASADCFVFASEEETMPLVLQESTIFSIPRIVSTYPGYIELIPTEDFAFLFPVGDIEQLMLRMQDFLESPIVAREKARRALELQELFLSQSDSRLIDSINKVFEFHTSLFPSEWSIEKS